MPPKAAGFLGITLLSIGCSGADKHDGAGADSTVVAAPGLPSGEAFLPVADGRVWYHQVGTGAGIPVILLHGGPGYSSYYLKLFEKLGDDRIVIRYDQGGSGKSGTLADTTKMNVAHFVAELDSLRSHLGYDKVHILGHSWGTILGFEYYRAHPDRVASLTLGSPALSIPAWEKNAKGLLKTISDSGQRAVAEAEKTGNYETPAYQAANGEFWAKYVMRSSPGPVQADLDSVMTQVNAAIYKVLHPEIAAAVGELFLREVRVTAQFSHPGILGLIDSGTVEVDQVSLPYYVMPVVEGESLRERLGRERLLPAATAVLIARQIALALAYAHDHGVVHRDIKPENVLLGGDHAVGADFGIAKAVTEATGTTLTAPGSRIGTPAYMSPEQASGEADVGPRSDLFSLGVVLYEMLAGELPFGGATVQSQIARRLHETPVPVRMLRPEVPEALDRVVSQALAESLTTLAVPTRSRRRPRRSAVDRGAPICQRRRRSEQRVLCRRHRRRGRRGVGPP